MILQKFNETFQNVWRRIEIGYTIQKNIDVFYFKY